MTETNIRGANGTIRDAIIGIRGMGKEEDFAKMHVAGILSRVLGNNSALGLAAEFRNDFLTNADQAERELERLCFTRTVYVKAFNEAVARAINQVGRDPDPTLVFNAVFEGAPTPPGPPIELVARRSLQDVQQEIAVLRKRILAEFRAKKGRFRSGANQLLALGGFRRGGALLDLARFQTAQAVRVLATFLAPLRSEEDAFRTGGIFQAFPDQVTTILGDMSSAEAVEERLKLFRTARDPRVRLWLVRSFKRGFFGRAIPENVKSGLQEALTREKNDRVRGEVVRTIHILEIEDLAKDVLEVASGKPGGETLLKSILAIRKFVPEGGEDVLRNLFKKQKGAIQAHALLALIPYEIEDLADLVEDASRDREAEVRIAAAIAAGALEDIEKASEILKVLVEDKKSWHVRARAVKTLTEIAQLGEVFIETLKERSNVREEKDRIVRSRIEKGLQELGESPIDTQVLIDLVPELREPGQPPALTQDGAIIWIVDASGSMTDQSGGIGSNKLEKIIQPIIRGITSAAGRKLPFNVLISVDRIPISGQESTRNRQDAQGNRVPGGVPGGNRPARSKAPQQTTTFKRIVATRRLFPRLFQTPPRDIQGTIGVLRAAILELADRTLRGDLMTELEASLGGVNLNDPGGATPKSVQQIIIATDGNPTAGPLVTNWGIVERVRELTLFGLHQSSIDVVGVGRLADSEGINRQIADENNGRVVVIPE